MAGTPPQSMEVTVGVVTPARCHLEALIYALGGSAPDLRVLPFTCERSGWFAQVLDSGPNVALVDLPFASNHAFPDEALDREPFFIALLQDADERLGISLLQLGFRGILFPNTSLEELILAIRHVHSGGVTCPPGVLAALLEQDGQPNKKHQVRPFRLSPREVEVMELAGQGLTTKAIAQRLGIERDTARNHIHNTLKKLQVHSRQEAFERLWAARRGTLPS